MYTSVHNRALGVMVGMLGPEFHEDDDNQHLLESIWKQQSDSLNPARGGALILMVDPNYPNPSSRWRRKFAEAREGLRFAKFFFALVTPAPHLRGVLTAINWMSPSTGRFESSGFEHIDQAVQWVESKLGQKMPILPLLLEEARAKAGLPYAGNQARASGKG